jgi:hypothetical protein
LPIAIFSSEKASLEKMFENLKNSFNCAIINSSKDIESPSSFIKIESSDVLLINDKYHSKLVLMFQANTIINIDNNQKYCTLERR